MPRLRLILTAVLAIVLASACEFPGQAVSASQRPADAVARTKRHSAAVQHKPGWGSCVKTRRVRRARRAVSREGSDANVEETVAVPHAHDGKFVDEMIAPNTDVLVDGAKARFKGVVVYGRVRGYADPVTTTIVVRNSAIVADHTRRGLALPRGIVKCSYITGNHDGMVIYGRNPDGPTVITRNTIVRDGTVFEDFHEDGIQMWEGGNVRIDANRIAGWKTSAIMLKTDVGVISHVAITRNYLENATGWYLLYAMDGGHGRPRFVTVTHNVLGSSRLDNPIATSRDETGDGKDRAVFVRSHRERRRGIEQQRRDPVVRTRRQRAGMHQSSTDARTWIVWNNNIDAESGREVPPPGGWHRPSRS